MSRHCQDSPPSLWHQCLATQECKLYRAGFEWFQSLGYLSSEDFLTPSSLTDFIHNSSMLSDTPWSQSLLSHQRIYCHEYVKQCLSLLQFLLSVTWLLPYRLKSNFSINQLIITLYRAQPKTKTKSQLNQSWVTNPAL